MLCSYSGKKNENSGGSSIAHWRMKATTRFWLPQSSSVVTYNFSKQKLESRSRKLFAICYYMSVTFLTVLVWFRWLLNGIMHSAGHNNDRKTTAERFNGNSTTVRFYLSNISPFEVQFQDYTLFFRIFYTWWNTRKVENQKTHFHSDAEIKQWVEDYKLVPFGPQALFPEYLEMGALSDFIVFMSRSAKS